MRPDQATLLDAVARFLIADVQPLLAGAGKKGVAFRALIAANLATLIAAELRQQERPGDEAARARGAALAAALRGGHIAVDGEAWRQVLAELRQELRADLATANPRFDLADDID